MNNKSKKKIHRDFGESAKDHRDISKPKPSPSPRPINNKPKQTEKS